MVINCNFSEAVSAGQHCLVCINPYPVLTESTRTKNTYNRSNITVSHCTKIYCDPFTVIAIEWIMFQHFSTSSIQVYSEPF